MTVPGCLTIWPTISEVSDDCHPSMAIDHHFHVSVKQRAIRHPMSRPNRRPCHNVGVDLSNVIILMMY